MKNNILTLMAFFLFCIGVGTIWLTAGAVDQETMGMGQAIIRCIIGLILLAIDVPLINYTGKENMHGNHQYKG